jgi:soluble lytic murein transglycosylase
MNKLNAPFLLFLFFLCFSSCSAQQSQSDFYEGLRIRAAATDADAAAQEEARKKAAALFAKALNSANVYVRQAAAEELANLMAAGTELSGSAASREKLLERVRREVTGPWAAAFDALYGETRRSSANKGEAAAVPDKQKVLAFLLGANENNGALAAGFSEETAQAAALFVLQECRKQNAEFFTETETAAIEGHLAAARSRYREGLVFFRELLDRDSGDRAETGGASAAENPAAIPPLFLAYPALLADLGRCFQYAAAGSGEPVSQVQGLKLFLEWEKNLGAVSPDAADADGGASSSAHNDIRFRLLFFAARIVRQRGYIEPRPGGGREGAPEALLPKSPLDQCMELFGRALLFAPDSLQADSCIWYILDSALSLGPAAMIRQLEVYAPQWKSPAYFADVLDKLSRELAARRQWKTFKDIFPLVQQYADSGSAAKYAWILARAYEEGYLSTETAQTTNSDSAEESPGQMYMRIAYNAESAPIYYRWLSAAALGKPFLVFSEKDNAAVDGKPPAAQEFLLGFFIHSAAEFAPRYIRALEKELAIGELRSLAEALANAELYAESIRLVTSYRTQKNYLPQRRDFELCYPRPFKELVERYAAERLAQLPVQLPARLPADALLFGLIRTESVFQSGIVSRAGAIGLTQLMPATAEEMAGRIHRQGGPDYAGADLRDSEINIHIGAVYLAYLQGRMEDTLLALLAYNGGMNRVRRWRAASNGGGMLPTDLFLETVEYPETREYGRKVTAAAAVYAELYANEE